MPEFPPAIAQYFDCINNERWESFPDVWTEDAELVGVGGHHYAGRDSVLAYYPAVLAAFPVHFDDAYTCFASTSGDVYTVEIQFRGNTAEGAYVEFEAVDVFTLRDGRIARLTTWYDVDAVRESARRPGPREGRLARIVERAATRSPFYRERGVDPKAELASLPTTTRAELTADPSAFATSGGNAVALLLPVEGGTLPLTHPDVADHVRILTVALATAGAKPGEVVAAPGPVPGLEAAAAACGATLLHGSTEGATVVLDLVSPPETGPLLVRCPHGELHLLADDHVLEFVTRNGDGAQLVVTPLGRRGAPLLRFETGIPGAQTDEPCTCGSPLPRLVAP